MFKRLWGWEGGAVHLRDSQSGLRWLRDEAVDCELVAAAPAALQCQICPVVSSLGLLQPQGNGRRPTEAAVHVHTSPELEFYGSRFSSAKSACRDDRQPRGPTTRLRSPGPKLSSPSDLLTWSHPLSLPPRISQVLCPSDGGKLQALPGVHPQPQSVRCQSLGHTLLYSGWWRCTTRTSQVRSRLWIM
jgi:hypothetical protein